jgi:hypothetical protein
MARPCAVVGIGQTKYRRQLEVTLDGLVREAALQALEDADMTFADIDAVVIGKAPDALEAVMMPELSLADALGAVGKPIHRVHTASSSSATKSSLRATPPGRCPAAGPAARAPAARSPRGSAATSPGRGRPSTSGGWWR